jgi:hypothetical protein
MTNTSNCVASRKYSISWEIYSDGGQKNANYWEQILSEMHSVNLKLTIMKSLGNKFCFYQIFVSKNFT